MSTDSQPKPYNGLRMTKQRKVVYEVLTEELDHPTAQVVFERVKERLPKVSLATIYNCLEALVSHGVIRQVNLDREPSKYCSNMHEHGHFHDAATGEVLDIKFKEGVDIMQLLDLPEGVMIENIELNIKGFLQTNKLL